MAVANVSAEYRRIQAFAGRPVTPTQFRLKVPYSRGSDPHIHNVSFKLICPAVSS